MLKQWGRERRSFENIKSNYSECNLLLKKKGDIFKYLLLQPQESKINFRVIAKYKHLSYLADNMFKWEQSWPSNSRAKSSITIYLITVMV